MTVRTGRILVALGLFGGWELSSRLGLLDPFFFSSPSAVAVRAADWLRRGTIWPHLATTVFESLAAFVLGSLLGIATGILLGRSSKMAEILAPFIQVANALPRVILAPMFLLWFGLGPGSKIALGVTVVFFIVFFNTFQGVHQVDPVLVDNVRMLGASEQQLLRHVLLPSALTWIFSSLHISTGMAIIAAVVGEYLGSTRGVGYLIAQAEGVFDTTGVMTGMFYLALVVLGVAAIVKQCEQRFLKWKQPAPAPSEETL